MPNNKKVQQRNFNQKGFIIPDWPVAPIVKACVTTRQHPRDASTYFNLATHVGDDMQSVLANREYLKELLQLSNQQVWLQQVHGDNVIELLSEPGQACEADAALTRQVNTACTVMTADCLPLLVCDVDATVVAAIHAGWRGLQQNIIRKTLQTMAVPVEKLHVWLGPAISAQAYEVDEQVYQQFKDYEKAFTVSRSRHWLMDLYAIARMQLHEIGVHSIYGGEYCTVNDSELFFSHRREQKTGRMASMIWLES